MPIDWVGLSLQLGNSIADIIKTAQPTLQERLIRKAINKVWDEARAEFHADKVKMRQLWHRLRKLRRGLRLARKYGLDQTKLLANMQRLLDIMATDS